MTNKKNKQDLNYKPLEWYYFIPILFIVGILPLIVFGKVVNLTELEIQNWKGGETGLDFFSYYKAILFAVFSILSIFTLALLKLINQFDFKKTKYYIPLAIYIVGVLLSYFFSDNPEVALRGFVEQFQGVWVMVGYGLVIFSIYNMVDRENQVKLILYGFVFSASLVGLIGIGQYFGADFFKSEFGRYLMLPETLHHLVETLKFNFEKYTIYATMYNTNYVGSFGALMLPLSVFLFFYSKDLKFKILSFIFTVVMMMTWIGSNSRAGYLGFAFGFIFMIILYRKKIKKDIKKIGALFIALVFIVVVMNTASEGRVLNQFSRLNPVEEAEKLEEVEDTSVRYNDVRFDVYEVTVDTDKEDLTVKLIDSKLSFFGTEGESLVLELVEDNLVTFENEKYKNYKVRVDNENNRFLLNAYGKTLEIYYAQDGFRMAGTGGVLKTTEYPPYLKFFEGREKFASSRGYIWSRSVPLLKDALIIGNGPGSYAIEFPQHDYVGKLNSFSNYRIIVDKPHNMYLQIGVNTGVMSLLALLALYLMYFIDSMKIYLKRDIDSFLEYLGIGAFTGIMAYLAAGMFNDQIISVAPLFYAMTGLGLAVNRMVKNCHTERKWSI